MNIEKRVLQILESKDIVYEVQTHEPVYTSEQAAKARGVPLETGVKAMILKTSNSQFVLALVPAHTRVDLSKIAELEGAKEVKLASPEEVLDIAGCKVGSVPPFGHKTQLSTYLDPQIMGNEYINFNAGKHTTSINMKARDLSKCISKKSIEKIGC